MKSSAGVIWWAIEFSIHWSDQAGSCLKGWNLSSFAEECSSRFL